MQQGSLDITSATVRGSRAASIGATSCAGRRKSRSTPADCPHGGALAPSRAKGVRAHASQTNRLRCRAPARAMHGHRLAPAIAGQGEKRAMANAALWLVLVPVVAGFLAIVFLLLRGGSLQRPLFVGKRRGLFSPGRGGGGAAQGRAPPP